MKSFKILSVLFLSFLFISSSFATSKLSDEDLAAVKKAVQEYGNYVDTQNADGMAKIIADNSTFVHVVALTNKTSEFSAADYLDALKNKTIGGWPRQLNILNVESVGNTAIAKIQAKDSRTTSTGFVTLLKQNDSWKIVCATFYMELNQNSASE
jgi:ketosteroid isomerase-like protein